MSGFLLDTYPASTVIKALFHTYNTAGASVTATGLANTDVEIYKDGGTTQRNTDAGVTVDDDFDAITGIHQISIDLGDNTDSGFFAAGSQYNVVVALITVDTQTVSFVLGSFRILVAEAAAGVPAVGVSSIANNAITAASIATGAIDADAIADNAIDAGAIAADAITAAKIADGAIDAATFATGAITAAAIATDAIGAAELAADAVTEIQSGLATAASITSLDGKIDTIDNFLDTEVAAIKAKTDSLTFTTANQVDANIQSVNDVTVQGTGALGDEWRP